MDEFVLGFEQQIGDRIRVGVFGQYRKLNDSLEDIAIDAAVNKYCDDNNLDCTTSSGSPMTGTGFHQYRAGKSRPRRADHAVGPGQIR